MSMIIERFKNTYLVFEMGKTKEIIVEDKFNFSILGKISIRKRNNILKFFNPKKEKYGVNL